MSTGSYHRALSPLTAAAADAGLVCLDNPLSPGGALGWGTGWRAEGVRHKAFVMRQHLRLARACRRETTRHILVREFSTVPLLAVAPRLWVMRRRLHFVVNHNLQWAVARPVERLAWRLVLGLGFRMVFFETLRMGLSRAYGLDRPGHWMIPFPMPDRLPDAHPPRGGKSMPIVGVAGHARPEKETGELLTRLTAASRGRWRVVAGAPNAAAIPAIAGPDRAAAVEVRDTGSPDAYRAFLRECDVVVMAPREEAYRCRPSGVLADAVAEGTPVVAPAFPLFQRQLSDPCAVGEGFDPAADMAEAIERALARAAAGEYDFESYRAARCPAAVARRLDAWMKAGRGGA